MKSNRPQKICGSSPPEGRRRWFLRGILLGVLLGLLPAYQLITPSAMKVVPQKVAKDGGNPQLSSKQHSVIGPACAVLAERIAQVLSVVERRQRAHSSLAAHIGSGWSAFRDFESGQREKTLYLAGRSFSDVNAYTSVLAQLDHAWKHERSRQDGLWVLLADAKGILLRCEEMQAREVSGPGQASVESAAPPNAEDLSAAVKIHAEKLTEVSGSSRDLPSLAELVVAAESSGRSAAAGRNGPRGWSQPLRQYVDWLDQWIYSVGGLTTPPVGADLGGVEASRFAVTRARASLLNGLMSIRVDPERLLRDLVAGNRGLYEKLLQAIDATEIKVYRPSETYAVWVESRLPLVGSGGLMPLVLPFNASRSRQIHHTVSAGARNLPDPSAEVGATDRSITAVVLDARGLQIEPALLPRVLSQSGSVVIDAAQSDLNDVAEHGFCSYTPYEGSARFQAGSRPLWLKVLGSDRPGELIIGDDDGARLRTASGNGSTAVPRLTVLVD